MIDDAELLRRYVADGSEPAFTELVSRNVDLVYAAALRHVADEHRARDIAQTVADRDGVARVRSREGRLYVLRPEKIVAEKKTGWSAFARARRAHLKALFPDGPVLTTHQAHVRPVTRRRWHSTVIRTC